MGLIPSTSVMILSHLVLTAAGRKSSPKVIMPDTSATSFNASCVTGRPEENTIIIGKHVRECYRKKVLFLANYSF